MVTILLYLIYLHHNAKNYLIFVIRPHVTFYKSNFFLRGKNTNHIQYLTLNKLKNYHKTELSFLESLYVNINRNKVDFRNEGTVKINSIPNRANK